MQAMSNRNLRSVLEDKLQLVLESKVRCVGSENAPLKSLSESLPKLAPTHCIST